MGYADMKARQEILKKGIFFTLLAIVIEEFFYASWLYVTSGADFSFFITSVLVFSHCVILIFVRNSKYEHLEVLMPAYVIFLFAFLSPTIIFFVKKNQLIWLLWFIPALPLSLIIFFPSKKGIITAIVTMVVVGCIFLVQMLAPYYLITPSATKQKSQSIINLFALLSSLVNSCIALIVYLKLYSLQVSDEKTATAATSEKTSIATGQKHDTEKHTSLYNNILKYFEKEKPYTDPTLTVGKLSSLMNTNTLYISQAIQLNTKKNFAAFINEQRIAMVKNMIAEGKAEEYTIQHIYTSAGFEQQTTFNRIFKSLEGISPSKYIDQQRQFEKEN
jgi:AraC-like DNA-binding protein